MARPTEAEVREALPEYIQEAMQRLGGATGLSLFWGGTVRVDAPDVRAVCNHLTAQAEQLTRIRNIVDAQDSTEDTPTLVEREIEALGKELAAKDAEIAELKHLAGARYARIIEWMRGRCNCCGALDKINTCKTCIRGREMKGTDNWTLPAGLEV